MRRERVHRSRNSAEAQSEDSMATQKRKTEISSKELDTLLNCLNSPRSNVVETACNVILTSEVAMFRVDPQYLKKFKDALTERAKNPDDECQVIALLTADRLAKTLENLGVLSRA
ncbi:hypothetical protein A2763_04620 [Candidatus Kaiserbacteria bacterium RIFCSPHIGHO2_01_FULL_54_36]|uniref:Uncharacterized protein n=1 Tax=Candidatus Kaiserbacteria bacterium RIFCSPHIGHO2_01_FULL_54_36 TaxID=1798482 RepID=A0A1F6CMZ2_9BACT|nr:MAG: hypothetical protein A2763_04620 [Candidatus Kaiserbacteria bacterium RIFCSPHIGHO2_01_FULL_54_36]